MDIKELIKNSIQNMDIEKIITEKTQEVIKETLESIIKDTFKSWSDFGKELQNKMSEELKINLSEIKLDEYNNVIISLLEQNLKENSTNNLYLKNKIDNLIKEISETDVKKEYKLSEIINLYKSEYEEKAQEDGYEKMYLKVKESSISDLIWIFINNKCEIDDEYGSDIQFGYNIRTDKIISLNIENKKYDSKSIYKNRLYGTDKLLYQMFLLGSKIIIDEKDCDLYYELEDEY